MKKKGNCPMPCGYFPPQCPGEHMGVGAPPSAKQEIDTALRSTKVTTIKRTIFFIGRILRGIAPTRKHHIFFAGGEPKCSKNSWWKTDIRRSTDRA